jgi:hypothetical protein
VQNFTNRFVSGLLGKTRAWKLDARVQAPDLFGRPILSVRNYVFTKALNCPNYRGGEILIMSAARDTFCFSQAWRRSTQIGSWAFLSKGAVKNHV